MHQEWNERGQQTKLTYSSGEELNLAYNEGGWLEKLSIGNQDLAKFDWALLGNPESETLGNGLKNTTGYDSLMRVTKESVAGNKQSLLETQYAYDVLDRVTSTLRLRSGTTSLGDQKTTELYSYNNLSH